MMLFNFSYAVIGTAKMSGFTGINIVQAVEIATIVGITIAGISLIVTAIKTKKQTKIDSANLSLELIKRVRETDFAGIVDDIFDEKSKECNQITLERLLNHFDMIAKFYEDNLLDLKHITQIYGGLLRIIKTDTHIQTILKKDKKLYQPLIKLYNKI